ncbi:LOW QUALITY PROTEIN: hypothetical protein PNEG_04267 [Pneumocystis murina B123]|uniref:Uncharacterized protein n=1 Tax=Pneumocystis murina (strain B123) TaxID=1069680 RepID=A0A0W4ZX29_PNEMU|nr:LOW QUALITY PROTEIN: hypothetical protein PNEG_04267 [Pneumocystis murina B123]KTW32930.1 LOW QUALITY PROTEIN: hypothetical protein PNEG_04267 [Pneumocystis murina B123]
MVLIEYKGKNRFKKDVNIYWNYIYTLIYLKKYLYFSNFVFIFFCLVDFIMYLFALKMNYISKNEILNNKIFWIFEKKEL